MNITPQNTAQLETFQDLLLKWNAKINLISRNTEHDIWQRHIMDSAQIIKLIPENAKTLIDFGSGAGLPGLIIAILKPEITVHLIESDARKYAFLREIKAKLSLTNVTIHNSRIEKIIDLQADIITARAFADVKTFIEFALPFQNTNCLNILLKGSNVVSEIENAKEFYDFNMEMHPSLTDETGKILTITNIAKKA